MPLRVPPQPRRFYRSNPLKTVICQLRFAVLLNFDRPDFLGEMQAFLGRDYPRLQPEQQVGLTLSPAGATPIPPSQLWRFRSADERWHIAVARDFISLETTEYHRFEEFSERLEQMLAALALLGVTYRERLGLRYVNEIRRPEAANPAAWSGYLNADLLGMVGGDVLGDDVIHALEDIRVREEDGLIVIRYGYVGPEPTQGDPFYLLDFDHFDEVGRELDAAQTMDQVNAFHRRIHDVFEFSITDAMRELLVVEAEGAPHV